MSAVKVAIVEDEAIIAEDLADILRSFNYSVVGIAKSYQTGLDLIKKQNPDIVLLDIKIRGELDGITLAHKIKEEYHLPFVFISSHSDQATVKRAADANPYGYLLKPFEDEDVKIAIEIALSNFAKENDLNADDFVLNDSIFIRQKNLSIKLPLKELLYVQADGNYSKINTKKQSYTIRATLKDLEPKLPKSRFFRSHKSYIINLESLDAVNSEYVVIQEEKIPIGRNQLHILMEGLNKL